MVRLALILLALPILVFGTPQEELAGWYWYDESSVESEEDKDSPKTPEQALAQMQKLQKKAEAQKALAILNPTRKNISDYIKTQNAISNRASTFAAVWQRTLQVEPELDYRHVAPVNQAARRVYYEEQREASRSGIESFSKKYGLMFFFRSDCPYCHKFAPILKSFEEKYGVEILPVSLDGAGLPEYPHPERDNGIARNMNITTVPAVLAIDTKSNEVLPVSYGLVSVDELTTRIINIQSMNEVNR